MVIFWRVWIFRGYKKILLKIKNFYFWAHLNMYIYLYYFPSHFGISSPDLWADSWVMCLRFEAMRLGFWAFIQTKNAPSARPGRKSVATKAAFPINGWNFLRTTQRIAFKLGFHGVFLAWVRNKLCPSWFWIVWKFHITVSIISCTTTSDSGGETRECNCGS